MEYSYGEQLTPWLKYSTSVTTHRSKLQQVRFQTPCWLAGGREGGDLLELSTVWDGDPLGSPPRPGTERLHFLDHIHSLLHAAKDNVPTIQPKLIERRLILPPLNGDIIH